MNILVTGGSGFIGTNLIEMLLGNSASDRDRQDWVNSLTTGDGRELENPCVINLEKLTYVSVDQSIQPRRDPERYRVVEADLAEFPDLDQLVRELDPGLVFHLAAETHVDRSIRESGEFIRSNVSGTHRLLEAMQAYFESLDADRQARFRLIHVTTDEVFGSLQPGERRFDEQSPYRPNSPYSASKAASDHLVRAWNRTYGLPTITSHSSNNFGPFQFPEKLVPVVILKCLLGQPIPLYGSGTQVRDWMHVDDHCAALIRLADRGRIGESYLVGAELEKTNLQLVNAICEIMDDLHPQPDGASYRELISFVEDRPGHDFRYAVNPEKLQRDTGWRAGIGFERGLKTTVEWYLQRQDWLLRHAGGAGE